MPKPERHVFVCQTTRPPTHPKTSCGPKGSPELLQAFAAAFEERSLQGRFQLTSCGCLGACDNGPAVLVYPEGVMYGGVGIDDIPAIIDEHLLGGTPVERLRVPAEVWG